MTPRPPSAHHSQRRSFPGRHGSRVTDLAAGALVGVAALILSSCSGSDTAAPTASSVPAADAADVGAATSSDEPSTPAGGGSCTVGATGATEFEYTTGGGPATIGSTHWFPVDSAGFGATPALVLNCDAGDGTLVALVIDAIEDLAFAPGSYDVPTPQTAVAVTTTGQFWAPTGAVTLQLDSFDDAGISGSMSFDAADSTGATITVAVTFDLDNPITG